MKITVNQVQGKVPMTVLALHGDLDASNYLDVIAKVKEVYEAGTRNLLIDMSDMPFMSSSGLVALHSIAMLFQGKQPPNPEHGWEAFHSIDRDSSQQKCVKLLNPQPRVSRTLEVTGLRKFFEVYTDLETAIASFG